MGIFSYFVVLCIIFVLIWGFWLFCGGVWGCDVVGGIIKSPLYGRAVLGWVVVLGFGYLCNGLNVGYECGGWFPWLSILVYGIKILLDVVIAEQW